MKNRHLGFPSDIFVTLAACDAKIKLADVQTGEETQVSVMSVNIILTVSIRIVIINLLFLFLSRLVTQMSYTLYHAQIHPTHAYETIHKALHPFNLSTSSRGPVFTPP